ADYLEVDSGGLRWMIDNDIEDMALGSAPERVGTRVRFEAEMQTERTLELVFSTYTEALAFAKTSLVVSLFTVGVRFVSRSEAKRLLHGLERFRKVVLDFKGVDTVGQGFIDEVFRVWASTHPETDLQPINMDAPVAFMVERARSRGAGES
ncbi:MAG: STAS-like domain-containing protein, partial [Acidobacteriota bacterium]